MSAPSKGLNGAQIAWRVAQDIPEGAYVNLGIGMPELVADHVPHARAIVLHSENGLLGVGSTAGPNEADDELINAGKKPITLRPGAALFHHADSVAMIRGGHIDLCVLGAFQVAANGDLANWSTGAPDAIPAIGGAMDLVAGVKRVVVLTKHTTKDGAPKLVDTCSYPLTGRGVVSRIYTDLEEAPTFAGFTIGLISIACAPIYLDRQRATSASDDDWRVGRPNLAAWFERFIDRPSFRFHDDDFRAAWDAGDKSSRTGLPA